MKRRNERKVFGQPNIYIYIRTYVYIHTQNVPLKRFHPLACDYILQKMSKEINFVFEGDV